MELGKAVAVEQWASQGVAGNMQMPKAMGAGYVATPGATESSGQDYYNRLWLCPPQQDLCSAMSGQVHAGDRR